MANKNHFVIIYVFLTVFFLKVVSPYVFIFLDSSDKKNTINIILELESDEEEDGENEKIKEMKYINQKIFPFDKYFADIQSCFEFRNSFFEQFRFYITPYHPSIPTPPPNFS